MEITKIPAPSQSQQSIPQQPPSDSPMSGSTITNPASVGSDIPCSSVASTQTTNSIAISSSTTPDINSILKGLLLIGAQSANPSAYAEFALQIANQIQKDGGGAAAGSNSSSNPSSAGAMDSSNSATSGFNSQSQSPSAAASASVTNTGVTETISSSMNPINSNMTAAIPSSSMNSSIATAVQHFSSVTPVASSQQSVQQLSQPVSSSELNTSFQVHST